MQVKISDIDKIQEPVKYQIDYDLYWKQVEQQLRASDEYKELVIAYPKLAQIWDNDKKKQDATLADKVPDFIKRTLETGFKVLTPILLLGGYWKELAAVTLMRRVLGFK